MNLTQDTPSRQEMVDYLVGPTAADGFGSLGAQVQGQVLDALAQMESMERSSMLQRLHDMTRANRNDIVGGVIHTGMGAIGDERQGSTRHYTVRPGDSLSKIARAYNVQLKALVAANPQIENPDLIHPNQVINLP